MIGPAETGVWIGEPMAKVDTWDHACGLLVVGAGGGLAGALAGVENGLDVLVIEKSAYVGGATSLSGGTLWILDNPFLKATGAADSRPRPTPICAPWWATTPAPPSRRRGFRPMSPAASNW